MRIWDTWYVMKGFFYIANVKEDLNIRGKDDGDKNTGMMIK